jgi:hypothetical protein
MVGLLKMLDRLCVYVCVSISFSNDKTLIPTQLMQQSLFSENSTPQEG